MSVNVIVGSGVFGLSTALELCKRKEQVIVIDCHPFCDFSSNSSDINRIVRSDYVGDPIYTPMAKESIETFKQWNVECNKLLNKDSIYNECGMLALSRNDIFSDSSCYVNDQFKLLNTKLLSYKDISLLYPMFNGIKENQFKQGYYSQYAGYCHSENTLRFIKYKCEMLNNNNIKFYFNTKIKKINTINIINETAIGTTTTTTTAANNKIVKNCRSLLLESKDTNKEFEVNNIKKLIFCTGVWTQDILKEFNLPLFNGFEIVPNIVGYFRLKNTNNNNNNSSNSASSARIVGSGNNNNNNNNSVIKTANFYKRRNFPVYLMDVESTGLYGFPPMYDAKSESFIIKIANHGILSPKYEMNERIPDNETKHEFLKLIKQYLPIWNDLQLIGCKVCLYNVTTDHHFVIDHIPNYQNISIATGGSGHAFKFAPNLGKIVINCLNYNGDCMNMKEKEFYMQCKLRFGWMTQRNKCNFFLKPIKNLKRNEDIVSKL